jgi:hypothetical protein
MVNAEFDLPEGFGLGSDRIRITSPTMCYSHAIRHSSPPSSFFPAGWIFPQFLCRRHKLKPGDSETQAAARLKLTIHISIKTRRNFIASPASVPVAKSWQNGFA